MQEEQDIFIFPQQVVVYATFGQRLLAAIIDALVLIIPNYIVQFAMGAGSFYSDLFIYHTFSFTSMFAQLLNIVISWLYMALMESGPNCASLGKMAMGIVVTTTQGERVSFSTASVRYFSKIISSFILYVGYFMMLWDDRNQTLHDKIAKTIVTKKQPFIPGN